MRRSCDEIAVQGRYRYHRQGAPLGGTGLLLGTFAGAAVWQTLENGLSMAGAPVGIQRIVIGIIVVGAVLLDIYRTNSANKVKRS